MRVVFSVDARPVPQGSMVASYNRKQEVAHVHHVQGTALAQWRASIRKAAKEAGATLSPSAISVRVVFGMPRPKAQTQWRAGKLVPKMQHYYDRPKVAPDLDKLVRSVLDSLTGLCYADDAQVVEIYASKVYADVTVIEVCDVAETAQQSLSAWLGQETEAHPTTG